MKKLITAFVAVTILSASASAVQVDGHCYLEGRTNHSGTKVLFQEDSPSAVIDSTYTDSLGYYQIELIVGIYDVIFSHNGCNNYYLYEQLFNITTTLENITLLPIGIPISGALSGFLEDTVYIIVDDIVVQPYDSLIIAPGVIIRFNGNYKFDINGYLYAVGTEEDSIKFIPNTGVETWGGIDFVDLADDGSIMDYCVIKKAYSPGVIPFDDGGGILIYSANPTIMHCTIIENSVADWGYGGGICCNSSNSYIYSCLLKDNSANGGGGIHCTNSSEPIISFCTIVGNQANYSGGGIDCHESSPTIENCTISGNSASIGGGIYCYVSHAIVVNTIVENNSGSCGFYILNSPNILIEFCNFYNNQYNNFAGNPSPFLGELVLVNSNGDSCDWFYNIFLDPLFYATTGDSAFYLTATSPCIDAGDPNSPLDPDSTIADIGAFYYDHTPPQPMPEITLSVDNLNFPATITGRYRRLPFNIRNTGNADLILYGMTFSLPAVFSHNWNSADSILAPGNNISIEVTFSPQDSINYSDSLTIANNDSAINVYLSGVGVNPVTISLAPVNPPIVISPNGGWFRFDAAAVNSSSALMRFDFWTVVTLPGVGSAQLMNHRNAPLDPGSRTVNFRQGVPAYAPGGTYIYYAYSGIFPWVVDDCDSFTFEKLGADGGSLGSPQDWPCDGWFFDDEESVSLHHSSFSIHNSYPNPFNAATAITFHLPAASNVKLAVYDIGGREIVNLASGFHPAGVYEVVFDGSQLSSGVYFARLEAGGFTQIRKLLLIK